MKVLLIDNYDSFTFNLYQCLGEILNDLFPNSQLDVERNDAIDLHEVKRRAYNRIILSPGPGNPADPNYFGVCKSILLDVAKHTPTLGVCLGLQGIAYYFGGKVVQATVPMHGKTSLISHDGNGVFMNAPKSLKVMRYHSLVVDAQSVPSCLEITARVASETNSGDVMGLRHRTYPLEGVQFHPESFATDFGPQLLANFLRKHS